MIEIVLDAIIPGDRKLKMPPASAVSFISYSIKYGIENIVNAFIFVLKKNPFLSKPLRITNLTDGSCLLLQVPKAKALG